MTKEHVSLYLSKINYIYPAERLVDECFDATFIQRYYRVMGKMYRLFHSREGAMHLPIKLSSDERHREKLLYQANTVGKLIKDHHYKTVVELGCGLGFNAIHLARIFPEVKFLALDVSDANIHAARSAAQDIPNLVFEKFDFDERPHTYRADLVYGIETLCYAKDYKSLMANIYACLNTDGRLVVFDVFENTNDHDKPLSNEEAKAYQQLCWGWAFYRFESLGNVKEIASSTSLSIEQEKDYTFGVVSNCAVYQKSCQKAVRFPIVLKLALKTRLLPKYIFMHIVSGIWALHFLESRFLGYYLVVFKK